MTTPLHKAVYRETETHVRDRSKRRLLIAGLEPGDVISIRLKGTRKVYAVNVETVYHLAARLAGEQQRREKAAARKLKKGTT